MKIALVGDRSDDVTAHRAIPMALELEANARNAEIAYTWFHTAYLNDANALKDFDGLWVVPASPYASFENALTAIKYARENKMAFLGTCGGFQHALVEYARSVLGYAEAGITEIDPSCPMPVVSALTCALIDQADPVLPEPGGLIASFTGTDELHETYRCSFGINPDLVHIFENSDLVIEARDPDGAIRAMRLKTLPFFLGTAFQPERAALQGRRHPIVSGFVSATAA